MEIEVLIGGNYYLAWIWLHPATPTTPPDIRARMSPPRVPEGDIDGAL